MVIKWKRRRNREKEKDEKNYIVEVYRRSAVR